MCQKLSAVSRLERQVAGEFCCGRPFGSVLCRQEGLKEKVPGYRAGVESGERKKEKPPFMQLYCIRLNPLTWSVA